MTRGRYRPEPDVERAFTSTWTPTEAEFEELFLDVATKLGWPPELRYHTHDSRRSREGFPDWVLVHPIQRRTIFVELKGWSGKPSDAQREWLAALDWSGSEAYLVTTTGDYARDGAAIAELLRRRPPRTVAT